MHPCARTWKELFLKTKIVISPNYAHGEPENCGIGVSVYLMLQIHYAKQRVLLVIYQNT